MAALSAGRQTVTDSHVENVKPGSAAKTASVWKSGVLWSAVIKSAGRQTATENHAENVTTDFIAITASVWKKSV